MTPRRPRQPTAPPEPAPVQAVERPILCSPYDEPQEHSVYGETNQPPTRAPGRRPASYFFISKRTGAAQVAMFAEPEG